MGSLAEAWQGPVDLPALPHSDTLPKAQSLWRKTLADTLYGEMPPPCPVTVTERALPGERARHLTLTLHRGGARFSVDAALWRPEGGAQAPLIAGLDFAGPAGVLRGDSFPLDPMARVYSRPELGVPDGRLTDALRGSAATRWPVDLLLEAGFAVLLSCYGSWVPDCPKRWQSHGLWPFLGGPACGAITLWAWGLLRICDAARQLEGIAQAEPVLAGHSRLGKAALWAAANDPRIRAVLATGSGCGGAAPRAHPVGETLARMRAHFPHWLLPDSTPALDQHALLAAIAPRAICLAEAEDDLWADPLGSYAALCAASQVWPGAAAAPWPAPDSMYAPGRLHRAGPLTWHMRAGRHDMTATDWRVFLDSLSDSFQDSFPASLRDLP